MNVLVVHPTGNKNTKILLEALAEKNSLDSYFTGYASSKGRINATLLPKSLKKLALLRSYSEDLYSLTHQASVSGFLQFIVSKYVPLSWLNALAVNNLFQTVDNNAYLYLKNSQTKPDLVIFHSGCGLKTAKLAKDLSIPVVMELPVAHIDVIDKLYARLVAQYPDWKHTLPLYSKFHKYNETDFVDIIICPSKFVFNSIPDKIKKRSKVIVNRYGYDENPPAKKTEIKSSTTKKLKVLFVGQLTQRKGVADIFRVANTLGSEKFEFTFVGAPIMPLKFYKRRCPCAIFKSRLSRDEVIEEMKIADIFLFPTYAEGRALVVLESLSAGLPVITTQNAGFDDITIHNSFGYVVKPGDCEAIGSLLLLIQRDKSLLARFQENIKNELRTSSSWSSFVYKYMQVLSEACS